MPRTAASEQVGGHAPRRAPNMETERDQCPNCSRPMTVRATARGNVRLCEHGCGVCINTSVLRQNVDEAVAAQAWQVAREASTTAARRCPDCRRNMRTFQLKPDHAPLQLEVCVPCMTLWFDQGEFGRLGGHFEQRRVADPARVAAIANAYTSSQYDEVDQALDGVLDGIFSLIDSAVTKWGSRWK